MIKTEDYLKELMIIFFSKINMVIGITIFFTCIALLVAVNSPPTYSANGTILIKGKKREKSPEALEIDSNKVDVISTVGKEDLSSEISILSSSNVLVNVLNNLESDKRFPELTSLPSDSRKKVRSQIRSQIKKGLESKILPSSTLIRVTLNYGNAQQAVAILENIFIEYKEERFKIFNPTPVKEFYQEQAQKFLNGSIALEEQLMEIAQQANTPEMKPEIMNNLITKRSITQEQIIPLESKIIIKKNYIIGLEKDITKGDCHTFSYLPVSPIKSLSEKVNSLLVEKAGLLSFFRPKSQKVQKLELEITAACSAIQREVTAYLKDQKTQLKGLQGQLAMQKKKLERISERNIKLYGYHIKRMRIEQHLDFQKESHKTFVQRLEEAKINIASETNNLFSINIIERPSTSGVIIFPQKKKLLVMGMVAGFIMGCCFSFIFAYFDNTIKTPDDILYDFELPVFYSLPYWKK